MKKYHLLILILAMIFGLTLINNTDASANTPTIFLHGYSGTHRSTDGLIRAAEKQADATKTMTINVQSSGKLDIKGTLKSKTKRPLIQINFINNHAKSSTQAKWITDALQLLQSKYHVKQYNVVAHSMGNVSFFQAVAQNVTKLPTLKKYVILAGPFNGVMGRNDAANKNKLLAHYQPKIYFDGYQQLLDSSQNFPKDVKILNIYGDLNDGTHSDGRVTVQSALSINYLLYQKPDTIKNIKMNGIQHSGLHNSNRVNQKWIKFLW